MNEIESKEDRARREVEYTAHVIGALIFVVSMSCLFFIMLGVLIAHCFLGS